MVPDKEWYDREELWDYHQAVNKNFDTYTFFLMSDQEGIVGITEVEFDELGVWLKPHAGPPRAAHKGDRLYPIHWPPKQLS